MGMKVIDDALGERDLAVKEQLEKLSKSFEGSAKDISSRLLEIEQKSSARLLDVEQKLARRGGVNGSEPETPIARRE